MKQSNVSAMGQNTYISLVPVFVSVHRHKAKHTKSKDDVYARW